MEQDIIKRKEHEEFVKRMEAEHERQNHRIDELEDAIKQYGALTIAVEKMAISMEQMLNEQKAQGNRLQVLESRDGELWRKVSSYIITAIVGLIIGFIFQKIGM